MVIKRYWYRLDKKRSFPLVPRYRYYTGYFLFGFIPLFIEWEDI